MTPEALPLARLSRFEAACVVARRDFLAILFSRAFLFFLLGPLFPVAVGGLAGNIGGKVEQTVQANIVALAMSAEDSERMRAAVGAIAPRLAGSMPELVAVPPRDPRAILAESGQGFAAVVSGTPDAPRLTGPQDQLDRWSGAVALRARPRWPSRRSPPIASSRRPRLREPTASAPRRPGNCCCFC
jgi:ABC-2 type transport system permease protein